MTTIEASTIQSVVDTYLEAYGEPEPARRAELIKEAWAPEGHLFDPPLDAQGHEAIDGMFAAVQSQFAGHSFRRSTGIDSHHGIARYGWELVAPDGTVTLAGMDVAVIGTDGKLNRVAGFFGELPPLA